MKAWTCLKAATILKKVFQVRPVLMRIRLRRPLKIVLFYRENDSFLPMMLTTFMSSKDWLGSGRLLDDTDS
jgi:hypothetical protein